MVWTLTVWAEVEAVEKTELVEDPLEAVPMQTCPPSAKLLREVPAGQELTQTFPCAIFPEQAAQSCLGATPAIT